MLAGLVGNGHGRDRSGTGRRDWAPAVAKVTETDSLVRSDGWELLEHTGTDAIEQSLELFERAVLDAPDDALAHAGLAQALARSTATGLLPRYETLGRARSAATTAVALRPDLAEAHTALALVELTCWNFDDAATSIDRARRLDPDHPHALSVLAQLHFIAGRSQLALATIDSARQVAPRSGAIQRLAGTLGGVLGSDAMAASAYRRAVELDALDAEAAEGLTKILAGRVHSDPLPDARHALDRLATQAASERVPPSRIAALYAGLGDEQAAVTWIERAWRQYDPGVFFVRYDTRWQPYLEHPRIRRLLEELSAS
jgi:tetratricopeptide (TPR) repeat protein